MALVKGSKTLFVAYIIFLSTVGSYDVSKFEFAAKLQEVVDFTLDHYEEFGFDGILGFVIAEGKSSSIFNEFYV